MLQIAIEFEGRFILGDITKMGPAKNQFTIISDFIRPIAPSALGSFDGSINIYRQLEGKLVKFEDCKVYRMKNLWDGTDKPKQEFCFLAPEPEEVTPLDVLNLRMQFGV